MRQCGPVIVLPEKTRIAMKAHHGTGEIDVTTDTKPGQSATRELFYLRRIGVVDFWWVLGFAAGFAVSGILAFKTLADELVRSPAFAMLRYIVTLCLTGLACSVVGAWIGHLIAAVWERWDLRRHPRRYEAGTGDERDAASQ